MPKEMLTPQEACALLGIRDGEPDLDSLHARTEDIHRAIGTLLPIILKDLPEREFHTPAQRQAVAERIRELLNFTRLRIACPKCGRPSVPSARVSGTGRDGVFQFSHPGSPATHGGTKRFPANLRLVEQPADRRRLKKHPPAF